MKSKQPNKNAVFHCDDSDFDVIIVLLLFIQAVWIIKLKKRPPKKQPNKHTTRQQINKTPPPTK